MPTSSTIQYSVQLQWSLLNPYKGLITCNTMGQYHGIQQTMCPNHVLDLNQLWLNPESRLTLTIPPLNLTWSNHQLPSNFYQGISHTPPYHLGLSPDFTNELPRVCMPYQVLQPYAHLHAKCSINFIFMYIHGDFTIMLLHPLTFPCSFFTFIQPYHWSSVIPPDLIFFNSVGK